jgi:hypothetical protein
MTLTDDALYSRHDNYLLVNTHTVLSHHTFHFIGQ